MATAVPQTQYKPYQAWGASEAWMTKLTAANQKPLVAQTL